MSFTGVTLLTATRPRRSRLMIAVLPDEASGLQAYRLLQQHGISPEHLALVGEGYSRPEQVGLVDPMQLAWKRGCSTALLTGSLGLAAGAVLHPLLAAKALVGPNAFWLVTALAAGAMGGFSGAVLGALSGFLWEGSASVAYRSRLRQGQYLLMLEGPEELVRKGRDTLSQYSVRHPD